MTSNLDIEMLLIENYQQFALEGGVLLWVCEFKFYHPHLY